MADRINQGYVITDSIQVGETEFVFGKMDSNPPMYVTWACNDEVRYQMERRERVSERHPKEPDKECER